MLSYLWDRSPWIDRTKLATNTPIKFTARDGMVMNGYLTTPINSSGKNLPMVVHPHGGPNARDYWRYDPYVQHLASLGYAVLQINFRGSTGYGAKHYISANKQFGLTMQDDITDGVEWAISKGIANKDNIAIYGGSYGGFLTRVNHDKNSVRGINVWPDNPMGAGAEGMRYRFQWNFPICKEIDGW